MAKPVLGKSVRSDWFLLGRDFVVQTETVQAVYFLKNVDIVILHRETTRKR